MGQLDDVLSEVAIAFSLPGLAFGDNGSVTLRVSGMGDVCFERWMGEGLAVAVYRDVGPGRSLRALELCAPSGNPPWPLAAVYAADERLGFMMRIPPGKPSAREVERCLSHIDGLFRALRE